MSSVEEKIKQKEKIIEEIKIKSEILENRDEAKDNKIKCKEVALKIKLGGIISSAYVKASNFDEKIL